MTEAEWFRTHSPDLLLLWLRTSGKQRRSARKIALFAVACAERIKPLMSEEITLRGLELAARLADSDADEASAEAYVWEVWESREKYDPQWPAPQIRSLPVVVMRVARREHQSPEKRACNACGLCAGVFHDHNNPRDRTRGSLELRAQAELLRDIAGNPFRPVTFSPSWRTDTALTLARQMYESREFSAMPILADALQDAGCDDDAILSHCRDAAQVHVRGCWVVDLVLNKA